MKKFLCTMFAALITLSLITGCWSKPAVSPDGAEEKPAVSEPAAPVQSPGKLAGQTLVKGIPDDFIGYPAAVFAGLDGSVYVLDVYDTDGMIKKFNHQGKLTERFGSTDDGLRMPVDIAVDGGGKAYVADMEINKVIVFSPEGKKEKEVGPDAAEETPFIPRSVAVDTDGNLVVLSIDAVWKFSPESDELLKFGGRGDAPGEFGTEGSEFYLGPNGVAVDASGNIYVADTLNSRIQVFDEKGRFLREITNEDVEGIFTELVDIAVDGEYIYVTDANAYNVFKIKRDGKVAAKLGGMGSQEGRFGSVGVEGTGPATISIGKDGIVFVADPYNHRVQVFGESGDFLFSIGGNNNTGAFIYPHHVALDSDGGILVVAGDQYYIDPLNFKAMKFDKTGRPVYELVSGYNSGRFVNPQGVAATPSGSIYLLDVDMVQCFDSRGRFLVNFGGRGDTPGNFGTSDQFGIEFGPPGIAVDGDGNIYVCDIYNSKIQKFSPSHQFIEAFDVEDPYDMAVDDEGNMFVLNSKKASITKLGPDGKALLAFGRAGTDAEALAMSDETGELSGPAGIAVDSNGRVYVSDTYNHRIVRYTKSGEFDAAFGGFGSGDTKLAYPKGIAVTAGGDIIVADYGNHRIQKLSPPE